MRTAVLTQDAIHEAGRLNKSLAFAEILRYLENSCYESMMATTPDQVDDRERIYQKVQALKDIQATLRNLAQEAGEGEPYA